VSVIVPAYNAAWCVERLLASIAAQTFSDFEAIVVNDGSKDETARIVAAFAQGDSRFRLIDQENAGVAAARNRALAEARGEFLAPVDADDLWREDYLAEMVATLDRPDAASAPFAFCYSVWIDADDLGLPFVPPAAPPGSDFVTLLRSNPVGNGSCAVFRRARVVEVGGYDATLHARGAKGGEDWKLTLELAAQAPAVVTPMPLVGYRRTETSLSGDPLLQARSSMIVLDDMRRRFPQTARQHLRDARTDFLVWVLPQWARRGDWLSVLRYGALAYLANPLSLRSAQARHLLSRALRGLLGRRTPTSPEVAKVRFGTR